MPNSQTPKPGPSTAYCQTTRAPTARPQYQMSVPSWPSAAKCSSPARRAPPSSLKAPQPRWPAQKNAKQTRAHDRPPQASDQQPPKKMQTQTRAHDRPPQARVIGGSRGGRGGWQAINDRLADGPGFLRFLDEAPQPVKSSSATTEHHLSSVTASWRKRVRRSLNALYRSCPMETDVGATNVKGGPTV